MNKKACFKSDGTKETGRKIINILELLGASNPFERHGNSKSEPFYYIDKWFNINNSKNIPKHYTLENINEVLKELEKPKQENLFPKWMRVYNTETCAVNRFVLCKYDNLYISLPMIKNEEELKCYTRADLFGLGINLWEFAEDIDENEEKINKLNEKLQKAIKMVEHFTEQINNLKTK